MGRGMPNASGHGTRRDNPGCLFRCVVRFRLDTPEQATRIVAPGSVAGRIWHSPPHEPRSSRREEAQSEIRNPKSEIRNSESVLTSAATVHGHNARKGPGSRASGAQSDADLFRFEARAGQTWIIETQAAQQIGRAHV